MWVECFHFLGICLSSYTTNNVENCFFKGSHGFLRFKVHNIARIPSIKKEARRSKHIYPRKGTGNEPTSLINMLTRPTLCRSRGTIIVK